MPEITKTSNFRHSPLKIAVAVSENSGEDENEDLMGVITEKEREILLCVLGEDQYLALQLELVKAPFVQGAGTNAQQEYVDLVQGVSGTLWQGLGPLLDNYIYCHWLHEDEVKATVIGTGKGKPKGLSIADNSSKYVARWNIFVDAVYELREYLEDSSFFDLPDDFPYFETGNSLGI